MSEAKNSPDRKCVGCGEMKPKSNLVRIVRSKEGNIFIDPTGKANGRGAYICRDLACFAKCRKAKRLDKAFGTGVPDEVYLSLEGMLKNE